MVKLILKSPYIKNTGNAGGYLKYIGTRENVELVPDARPPTKRQTQLINKLLQDFPNCKNSYEYSDYHATPTKVNASALITMANAVQHFQPVIAGKRLGTDAHVFQVVS